MNIFTIGFTQKTAEQFFSRLKQPGLLRVVDARLNNVSQLAGFTKKNDLQFFLSEICNIEYIHIPLLAPTKDILDAYKKNDGDWFEYEKQFLQLMKTRRIEKTVKKELIDGSCLLCSEPTPDHCHRRLVAEYFHTQWDGVKILHL